MPEPSAPLMSRQRLLYGSAAGLAGLVLFGLGLLAGRAMSSGSAAAVPAPTASLSSATTDAAPVAATFRTVYPADCLNRPDALTTAGMASCWSEVAAFETEMGDANRAAMREGFARLAANPNDPESSRGFLAVGKAFDDADAAWAQFTEAYCTGLSGLVETADTPGVYLTGSMGMIDYAACSATLAGLRYDLINDIADKWFP